MYACMYVCIHTYILLSFAGSMVVNPDTVETQVMDVESGDFPLIDVPVLHRVRAVQTCEPVTNRTS